jgi:serine/threonine protein kinase
VNEIKVLSNLEHPNIVKYRGVFLEKEKDLVYIVLDFCE